MIISLAALAAVVQSQPQVTNRVQRDTLFLSGPATCQQCRVRLRTETTLRLGDELDLEIPVLSVARTAGGNYVTTGLGRSRSVGFFDGSGSFVKTIGREGSGPGEYILPGRVVPGPGDSVTIIDGPARRLSVLGPAGEFARLVRTVQVAPSQVVFLPSGGVILQGRSYSKEGAGFALHRVGAEGVSPIGEPLARYNPADNWADLHRSIAAAAPRSFWSARTNRYEIERWSEDGHREVVVVRNAEWFQPWTKNALPVEAPTRPSIYAVRQDSIGRLWVFISVTSSQFKALKRGPVFPGSKTGERPLPDLRDVYRNYDTVVEVIDVENGKLVSTTRFAGWLVPAEPFPLVARVESDGDSDLVRIYSLEGPKR